MRVLVLPADTDTEAFSAIGPNISTWLRSNADPAVRPPSHLQATADQVTNSCWLFKKPTSRLSLKYSFSPLGWDYIESKFESLVPKHDIFFYETAVYLWNNRCGFNSETTLNVQVKIQECLHYMLTAFWHIETIEVCCWWVSEEWNDFLLPQKFYSFKTIAFPFTTWLESHLWDFFFLNRSCVWGGRSPGLQTEVQGSLLLVAEGKEHHRLFFFFVFFATIWVWTEKAFTHDPQCA